MPQSSYRKVCDTSGNRPSFVFSGEQVGADQEGLLKNVYPQAYTAATRDQINEQSLVKAYANPLLLALVLSVIENAQITLSGIELVHMMRKRQARFAYNPSPSIAEQFEMLTA
ncbi:hypothetical protein X732_32585 [Mesorhizobium sp. L2C066B000]|nr:hypothetical protein X732_32585 [Mesorhizobium sp. L2C066B000]